MKVHIMLRGFGEHLMCGSDVGIEEPNFRGILEAHAEMKLTLEKEYQVKKRVL